MSRLLNIENDEATNLRKIEVENIFGKNKRDEVNIFKIRVLVKDTKILPNLENGIVSYLEKNPYVKKRIELRKLSIESQLDYVRNELKEMENLKEKVIAGQGILRDSQNNLVMFDPVSIYEQSLNLFKQELELQDNSKLIDNFQVMQPFTVFNRPVGPKLINALFIGILLSLIGCTVLVFVLELNRIIKKGKKLQYSILSILFLIRTTFFQ